MNKPARFKQCELRRAQKVAQEFNSIVEIVDGKIRLLPNNGDNGDKSNKQGDKPEGVELL
jgi:hypothetical protein